MGQKRTFTSLLFVTAVAVTAGLVACNPSGPPPPPMAHLDDLQDRIRGQIEDPQLESDMLAEVDRMQDALEEMVEVISRHQDALFAIYRDYDSTREEIEDETRAERVLNIMKNSTDSISDRLKEVNDALEDWRDADRNPSTGHEEFEQALAQVGTYRETAQQIGVDALFALRAEMSREEWIAVFGDGS